MDKIVSIRRMEVGDLFECPESILADDHLAISIYTYDNAIEAKEGIKGKVLEDYRESLECGDYVKMLVSIHGKCYTVLHGFPGDNSAGVFILNDDVWYRFGEAVDYDFDTTDPVFSEFVKWYICVTDNEMSYEAVTV